MKGDSVLAAVNEVLCQGEALIGGLDDLGYTTKLPEAYDASIGSHYRHCLDHFALLLQGLKSGDVNYDARARNPAIETVRESALAQTRDLLTATRALHDADLGTPLVVRCKISYAGDVSPEADSTLGREMMFCVIHAVHHYALIRVMAGLMRVSLPSSFGIAPSTVHHASRLAA